MERIDELICYWEEKEKQFVKEADNLKDHPSTQKIYLDWLSFVTDTIVALRALQIQLGSSELQTKSASHCYEISKMMKFINNLYHKTNEKK